MVRATAEAQQGLAGRPEHVLRQWPACKSDLSHPQSDLSHPQDANTTPAWRSDPKRATLIKIIVDIFSPIG
jgi:hypothetical protein